MTSPSSSGDAFSRVSAALLAVWPSVANATAGLSRAETGRVLDECGSDYRPLVSLLLDIGHSVRPALLGRPNHTVHSWPNVRAPLVHQLVSTRYLQPDVARWAVDVWGRALGVAPLPEAPVVDFGHAPSMVSPPNGPARGAVRAAGTAPSVAPARPPVVTPQQVPAALRGVPSWAGGPVSFGVGQRPKAAGLAALAGSGRVVVRAPVAPGPMFQPAERRAAIILISLLVIISVGLTQSFKARPTVTTPVDAPRTAAPVSAPLAAALPRVPDESVNPAPTASAIGDARDTATMVVAPPAVDSVTRMLAARGAVREAGVGGRYLVTQRVRDVSGSESCDAVAGALAGGRETEERVVHIPGSATFTLVTRGVTGTLASDGLFVSEPRAGTTNNVNWQFRMRGRFGPDGFTGESTTHTDAILRWGRLQTCVVTADLSGQRLSN